MKFEKIVFWTTQLAEIKHFYTAVLQYELLDDGNDDFTIGIGATQLTFRSVEEGHPFYHFAINIPENKLSEAKAWISSRVELIKEEEQDEVNFQSWDADSIYFEDPAGNIVEFIARHQLNNGITHSFTVRDSICVSGVGIVVDEVIPFVRALNQKGIPNWREDSEGLTPVGDENGLFIVVKKSRTWYFSNNKQAQFYPVEVLVQGLGELRFF